MEGTTHPPFNGYDPRILDWVSKRKIVQRADKFLTDEHGTVSYCMLFRGCRNEKGYGRLRINGVDWYAHRLVLAYTLGRPLVLGEIACHLCDNPDCVNPKHLVLGDIRLNNQHSAERGRRNRKGKKYRRLTVDEVLQIRLELRNHGNVVDLAVRHNVGTQTIRDIRDNSTWKGLMLPSKQEAIQQAREKAAAYGYTTAGSTGV